MIYDVNSPLFRSFLSQKGGASDKRYFIYLLFILIAIIVDSDIFFYGLQGIFFINLDFIFCY